MKISDKTALITGGASGLGAATARLLHAGGAQVLIVDMDEDQGRALEAELGAGTLFCRADVRSDESLANAVKEGEAKFGPLHHVVCCAGIAPPARVLGRAGPMPLESFSNTIAVNLIGSFNAVRLGVEWMMKHEPESDGERGVVVVTASVAAYEGQIGQSAYAASKGGLVSMVLPMSREFAGWGIRVMALAPGLFDTPLLAGLPEDARRSLGEQVPFPPRLGIPTEFAQMVRTIIETPLLNGSVIRLDGALRMAAR